MKILVVDDHPGMLKLVAEVLRLEGNDVYEAPNPNVASRFISEHAPFDLIVTDIDMPHGGGEAVAKSALNTPILAMSGTPDADHDWAGGFISKPFKLDDLVLQVNLMEELFINKSSP